MATETAVAAAVIAWSAVTVALANVLNIGIARYKFRAAEIDRTLVNNLTANLALICAFLTNTILSGLIGMHLLGSLNAAVCDAILVVARTLVFCYFLTVDAISLMRYLHIVRSNLTFSMIAEDFMYTFLTVAVVGLSVYLTVLLSWFDFHRTVIWYRCVGKGEEATGANAMQMYRVTWAVVAGSVFLHVALFIKVVRFQRRVAAAVVPAANVSQEADFANNNAIGGGNSYSSSAPDEQFIRVRAAVCFSIGFSVYHVATALLTEKLSVWMGMYKATLWPFNVLWNVSQVAVVLPIIIFWGNEDMRKKVLAPYAGLLKKLTGGPE